MADAVDLREIYQASFRRLVARDRLRHVDDPEAWLRTAALHPVSGVIRPAVRHDVGAVPDEPGRLVSVDDGATWPRVPCSRREPTGSTATRRRDACGRSR